MSDGFSLTRSCYEDPFRRTTCNPEASITYVCETCTVRSLDLSCSCSLSWDLQWWACSLRLHLTCVTAGDTFCNSIAESPKFLQWTETVMWHIICGQASTSGSFYLEAREPNSLYWVRNDTVIDRCGIAWANMLHCCWLLSCVAGACTIDEVINEKKSIG